jgi:ketosteroid isomerase-like protein
MPSMKKLFLSVALLGSAALVAFAQEKKTLGPLADVVLRLEQQWDDALTKSDVSALEKLYDDSIVYTHSNGKVDTKESYLSAIKSGATQYQSMTRDDIKVSVYGHTAVVTCHWEVHVVARGNKIDTNARYLHVYVEQPNGWKLVAHESTRIAP